MTSDIISYVWVWWGNGLSVVSQVSELDRRRGISAAAC